MANAKVREESASTNGCPDEGNPTKEKTDHHRPASLGVALAAACGCYQQDGPGVIALVPGRGSLLLFSYKTHWQGWPWADTDNPGDGSHSHTGHQSSLQTRLTLMTLLITASHNRPEPLTTTRRWRAPDWRLCHWGRGSSQAPGGSHPRGERRTRGNPDSPGWGQRKILQTLCPEDISQYSHILISSLVTWQLKSVSGMAARMG